MLRSVKEARAFSFLEMQHRAAALLSTVLRSHLPGDATQGSALGHLYTASIPHVLEATGDFAMDIFPSSSLAATSLSLEFE